MCDMQDEVVVAGNRWLRTLLRTRWLSERDDLGAILEASLAAVPADRRHRRVLAVAEKVAIVTSGRVVPAGDVRVSVLARVLARTVRPVGDSRGLSIPEKMQYVLDHAGLARILAAAAAGAATRPLGVGGAFYRVAGSVARDLDGLRGAYERSLLPPLLPSEARLLAHHLAVRLDLPVAIVDINDRGGTVRGCSPGCTPARQLLAVLHDNPLGQADQSTPAILLRN